MKTTRTGPRPKAFLSGFPRQYLWAVLAAALSPTTQALAEVELPRESPVARVSQQVGLTEISLEYSSPAVKGRRIWGGLVSYDKPWSISANRATTIRFSKEVSIGGKSVAAGTYRLYAMPSKDAWSFILDPSSGKVDDARDFRFDAGALRFKAQVRPSQHRERLTFLFSDFTDDKASLDLEWEKIRASLLISTNTAQQMQGELRELDRTWRSYANAARFMLETTKDYDAGLRYAEQSLALKEDWYTLWIKASLLAAKRDFKGATDAGEKSYALGQQLGDGFVLEPELKKAVADWKSRR